MRLLKGSKVAQLPNLSNVFLHCYFVQYILNLNNRWEILANYPGSFANSAGCYFTKKDTKMCNLKQNSSSKIKVTPLKKDLVNKLKGRRRKKE